MLLKHRVLTALKVIRVCVCVYVRACQGEIVSVIASLAAMSFTRTHSQVYYGVDVVSWDRGHEDAQIYKDAHVRVKGHRGDE